MLNKIKKKRSHFSQILYIHKSRINKWDVPLPVHTPKSGVIIQKKGIGNGNSKSKRFVLWFPIKEVRGVNPERAKISTYNTIQYNCQFYFNGSESCDV